jgi:endogenous inhibitor of DNA gyrase (YacG/DUF329 family)
MIDLNRWHHRIHQVTGEMAIRFNRATPIDLACWAMVLRTVAAEMEAERAGAGGQDQTPGDEAVAVIH